MSARVIGDRGPLIYLIHGLGRVSAAYSFVAAHLRDQARLVLVDNPGFGGSLNVGVPLSIRGHAALHRRTLDALGFDEPVHLAGLSLGGMIAPALAALLGRDRVASLSIFASSSLETGLWRLSPRSVARTLGRVLRTLSFDHHVQIGEIVRPEVIQTYPELSTHLDRLQRAEGFRFSHGTRQLIAASHFRLRPLRDQLPARTWAIVGEADRLVSPRHSERLAALLGCPLCIAPAAAHDFGLSAPRTMAACLLRASGVGDLAEVQIEPEDPRRALEIPR